MVLAEAPNAADWMQGWGAVVSLPLSLLAVLFTGWLLRHELKTRREERQDQDARQARLVRFLRGEEGIDEDADTYAITFKIANRSNEPIFNVHLLGYEGGKYVNEDSEPLTCRLAPGAETTGTLDLIAQVDEAHGRIYLIPSAILVFEDAEGRMWVRPQDDQPRRWLGPGLASYKSDRGLLCDYIRTYRLSRWLSWQHSRLLMAYRQTLERRIRAKDAADNETFSSAVPDARTWVD